MKIKSYVQLFALMFTSMRLLAQPNITQQPTDQVATNGGNATFSVTVSGTAPFNYKWLFNSNDLPPFIVTVAGSGTLGDGVAATNARLLSPQGVALDSVGNLFIADTSNNRIRKVDTNGIITTVAGNGSTFTFTNGQIIQGFGDGGSATNANLQGPSCVAIDFAGNLFIADHGDARIRRVDTNGIITTVAGNGSLGFTGDGGAATNAMLWQPSGVVIDSGGNLLIADTFYVRKVDTNGIITTIAGNGSGLIQASGSGDGGPATNAPITPFGIALDNHGNLFVGDWDNERVRKIDTNGIITTVAGGGNQSFRNGNSATNVALTFCYCVAVDSAGNLFIADNNVSQIHKVDTNGTITTVAGNGNFNYSGDGNIATNASLGTPYGIAVDILGNLFIADNGNNCIRKVFTLPTNLPILDLANVTTNNIGDYSVIVSNADGSATSSTAVLNMPVFITVQPTNLTALATTFPTLSVSVAGSMPFSYQWMFMGTNLIGETNSTHIINNVSTNNVGNYNVAITNLFGSATSQTSVLTVAYILQQPTNQIVIQGSAATFNVTLSTAGSFFINGNLMAPTYQAEP